MEDVPYSDQLIRALRQLRARVIEVRAGQHSEQEQIRIDLELFHMFAGAVNISLKWFASLRLPMPLPGAGLAELGDYASRASDVLRLEEELAEALAAISPDFSVEAIDNAIRVAESQA